MYNSAQEGDKIKKDKGKLIPEIIKKQMANTAQKEATEKTKSENDAKTTLTQADARERQNTDLIRRILDLLNQIKQKVYILFEFYFTYFIKPLKLFFPK